MMCAHPNTWIEILWYIENELYFLSYHTSNGWNHRLDRYTTCHQFYDEEQNGPCKLQGQAFPLPELFSSLKLPLLHRSYHFSCPKKGLEITYINFLEQKKTKLLNVDWTLIPLVYLKASWQLLHNSKRSLNDMIYLCGIF